MNRKPVLRCFVLSLQVNPTEADALAEQVRERWKLEPVLIARPDPSVVWIELYFDDAVRALLAERVFRLDSRVQAVSMRGLAERDWTRFWKRHFHSFNVGEKLRISPVWEKRKRPGPGRRTVIIDPGMSFGTGEHFTTRFCLEALEKFCRDKPAASLLDVGTGSGILALAAARLGVKRVVATDTDKQALACARANLALNKLQGKVRLIHRDVTTAVPRERFEMVCANLYAGLLLAAADNLVQLTRRLLILSGIQAAETDWVVDAFLERGGKELIQDGNGEWAGLVYQFPG